MFNRRLSAAAALGTALAGAAVARNFNLNPAIGTVNLRGGSGRP